MRFISSLSKVQAFTAGILLFSGCSSFHSSQMAHLVRLNETPLYKTADGVEMKPLFGRKAPTFERAPETRTTDSGPSTSRLLARLRTQLFFDTASDRISPAAKPQLDELAQNLSSNKDSKISIEGDTDSTGPLAYNDELSKRRANAVSSYLEGKGVPRSQLELNWKGEKHPIAENSTRTGRAKNRRVELRSSKSEIHS